MSPVADDILRDIKKDIAANRKLRRIAEGSGEQLTQEEAMRIVKKEEWLSKERESLLRDCPED